MGGGFCYHMGMDDDDYLFALEVEMLNTEYRDMSEEVSSGAVYENLLWIIENSPNKATVDEALRMRREFRENFPWAKPDKFGR